MCEQKIFIDVEYLYIPRIPYCEKGEYRATIWAYIPEATDVFVNGVTRPISKRYQNSHIAFFTEPLRPTWGWRSDGYRNGYRYQYMKMYEPDLQTLQQRVKEYIDKEIEKLRKVVEQNVLAAHKVPESEHYEFVI
ncbi:MAG: hypothetical protein ACTSR2_00150 [Candidatus Hodarchaeales archaeon]